MTEIIEPKIAIQLVNSLPSGPAGSTSFVAPLNPPPPPPGTWAALTRGLNSGEAAIDLRGVATDGTNWVAVGRNGRAARSTDAGATWAALPQGLNSGLVTANFIAVAAGPDGVFVATGDAGYSARSADGGATWAAATRGLGSPGGTGTNFNDLTTDGAGSFIACAGGSDVGYSTDNGVTWQAGGTIGGGGSGVSYRGVSPISASNFIMVAENGLVGLSSDDGATFGSFLPPQGLNTGNTNNDFHKAAVVGQIIVIQSAGILTTGSTDGGSTWTRGPDAFNSGNPGSQNSGSVVSDTQNVMVSVQENGWAAVTANQGTLWTALPRGLNSGNTAADWNAVATDNRGNWVAVADSGYAARGTE